MLDTGSNNVKKTNCACADPESFVRDVLFIFVMFMRGESIQIPLTAWAITGPPTKCWQAGDGLTLNTSSGDPDKLSMRGSRKLCQRLSFKLFVRLMREESIQIPLTVWAIIGPPAKRYSNDAILMAFHWQAGDGPTLNTGSGNPD